MTRTSAPQVTGVILAGGKSSRMGVNKALLPLWGVPCVQHVADRLRPACDEVIVVAAESGSYSFLSLPVVLDIVRDAGPLAGIHAALSAIGAGAALVLSCDAPMVNRELLLRLARAEGTADAVLVRSEDGRVQPLCGLYRRSCLTGMAEALARGRRSVVEFLGGRNVDVRSVADLLGPGAESGLLLTMNTPEEYRRLCGLPPPAAGGERSLPISA